MHHPTRTTWITLACLTFGILTGCAAIGSLIVSSNPPPFVPHLLAASVALAPVALVALLVAALWKPARTILPAVLFLGGITIPADLAFLCLLDLYGEETLRLLIGGLLVIAAAFASIPVAGARGRCLLLDSAPPPVRIRAEPEVSR